MSTTHLGRLLTDEHRRWQALMGATVAAQAQELATMIDPRNIRGTIDLWLEQMLAVMAVSHLTGTEEAQRYVQAFREAEWGATQASTMPILTEDFDLVAAAEGVVWAPRLAQSAINQGAAPSEAWAEASRALTGRVMRDALTPGRNVVTRSAEAAGSFWRRVSDGKPCAWCAMLVTRGPVYSAKTVLTTRSGRRYHDYCGCTAEEFRGDPLDWEPTAQEQKYIDLYMDASEPGDDDKTVARKMRELGNGVVNDAHTPKTQTGGSGDGSGSGGKPPKNRSSNTAANGESGDEAYWDKRQSALGIDTKGEKLDPDEILFVERMTSRYPGTDSHSVLEWLARDRYDDAGNKLPTNDFIWLNYDGQEWELKSPSTSGNKSLYDRIKARIKDDMGKGKTRFVIDIGEPIADEALLANLEKYKNQRGCEVIVLSNNGRTMDVL